MGGSGGRWVRGRGGGRAMMMAMQDNERAMEVAGRWRWAGRVGDRCGGDDGDDAMAMAGRMGMTMGDGRWSGDGWRTMAIAMVGARSDGGDDAMAGANAMRWVMTMAMGDERWAIRRQAMGDEGDGWRRAGQGCPTMATMTMATAMAGGRRMAMGDGDDDDGELMAMDERRWRWRR